MKIRKWQVHQLSIITIMHLFVDFICVSSIMAAVYGKDATTASIIILIYNCLAFLSQPLFGYLVDKLKEKEHYKIALLFSSATLILGWLITTVRGGYAFLFIGAPFLGFGNALFHVIGGKESLTESDKATPGGLFVSAGAIGVGLGTLCFRAMDYWDPIYILYNLAPIIILILSLLHLKVDLSNNNSTVFDPFPEKKTNTTVFVIIVLCLAIAIRSFLGYYPTMSEALSGPLLVFLVSFTAFSGKAIGGIILDLTNPYILIVISTITGILSGFFLQYVPVDYLFILSVNLLMPLTLNMMRRLFPEKEGFAFGLAAAFLIPGYLFASILKQYTSINLSWSVSLATGIMLCLCYYFISRKEKCSAK